MSLFLAVDGGATITRAGLYAADGTLLKEAAGAPCNPVEYGVDACVSVLLSLSRILAENTVAARISQFVKPRQTVDHNTGGFAAGISGARQEALRDEIARAVCRKMPVARAAVTDDLHPILYANAGACDAVLVIAGTGSSVLAQAADGRSVIVGGRGRLFGDEGSAYQIAVAGLRAASYAVDGMGRNTRLAAALPSAAGVETFAGLVSWSASASKQQVAALASTVDALAAEGDAVSLECIVEQAQRLAEQTSAALGRLAMPRTAACYLNGGVFSQSALFLEAFKGALARRWPEAKPEFPRLLGHRAVLALAMAPAQLPEWVSVHAYDSADREVALDTERRLPRAVCLDRLTAIQIVEEMNREDKRVAEVVARSAPEIARAIDAVVQAFGRGGRLIYVGAGTSGRLGVLDAAECTPTFGVPRDKVIAVIAGGRRALVESVEGAEDDVEQAVKDMDSIAPPVYRTIIRAAVCARDVVVGIAASGRTPYTLAALRRARAKGAGTILLCCNPPVSRTIIRAVEESVADVTIVLETGAEVLPGSTRLKAGTATKMVLNMISTGALALSGYVYEGRMVGVRPTNSKLRERAIGIVRDLTGLSSARISDHNTGSDAERMLQAAGGSIPIAMIMARKGTDAASAASLLEKAGGRLREALEKD